jgi:hypothetical protein
LVFSGGSSSIPARTEPWGYDTAEDSFGQELFIKNLPPTPHPSKLGPSSYSLKNPDTHSVTTKYKGAHFGQKTSARVLLTQVPAEGLRPDPGVYHKEAPFVPHTNNANFFVVGKEQPGFASGTVRPLGALQSTIRVHIIINRTLSRYSGTPLNRLRTRFLSCVQFLHPSGISIIMLPDDISIIMYPPPFPPMIFPF